MRQDQPDGDGVTIGRGALASLLACGIFTTIGLFSPGLVLPQIERAFESTPHAALLTGLVGTLASFSFAVGAPFAGALIARFGCRRTILPSLIGFAIAGAAPAMLDDLYLILAARVCLGLALAGIFTGALAGIGGLHPHVRARMFGWFSVVGGGAAILLFPAVGALGQLGWQPAFLVNLIALAVIPLVLALPCDLGSVSSSAATEQATGDRLFSPAMIGLLLLAAMAGMGMLIGPIYSPLYLASLGVADTRLMAIPPTLGSIAAVIAAAGYGHLHQKVGLNGISTISMVVIGGALLMAGATGNVMLFTFAIMLQSAMTALMAPNVSASAMAFAPPAKAGQAIGLANGVMFGAQLLFPFIATWLRMQAGLTAVFLGFGAATLLIGLAMAARIPLRRRRSALA